jgi:nitrite reductase (NADH) large subunit
MDYDVVIIGAGPAGFNAAKAASQRKRKLLLAGAEPYLPYWRPRLPEVIGTGETPERILMSGKDWFSENGVEIQLSKMAARIDAAQKTVQWSDGSSTSYDSLILSCGALPNRAAFPFEKKVFTLRSYQDAMEIRQRCAATKKAFLIGGGSLGLETAFALAKTGCRVAVSVRSYPLSRQLDSEGGKFLTARLKESGITICCGDLTDYKTEIDGACVIAATGVHPDLTLAEKCGIKISRGILVDEKMRTNLQGIYACGDIAEYNGTVPGLMSIAVKQGETAGINASGGDMVYQAVLPAPLTKVAGLTIFSFGSLKLMEDTKIYRKVSADSYAAIAVRSCRIIGAAFIGNVALGTKLKKWMEAGREIGKAASFEEIEKMVG